MPHEKTVDASSNGRPPLDPSRLTADEQTELQALLMRHEPRYRPNGRPDLSHDTDDELQRMLDRYHKMGGVG